MQIHKAPYADLYRRCEPVGLCAALIVSACTPERVSDMFNCDVLKLVASYQEAAAVSCSLLLQLLLPIEPDAYRSMLHACSALG